MSSLDSHRSISTLGFDSLMAVELRNQIQTELGVAVSMAKFLQGPSISQLAKGLLDELLMADARPTPSLFRIRPIAMPESNADSIDVGWEEEVL